MCYSGRTYYSVYWRPTVKTWVLITHTQTHTNTHTHTHTHTQIMDAVMKCQTMSTLAKDMDRWIEKRDELSRKVEELKRQRHTTLHTNKVVCFFMLTLKHHWCSMCHLYM